MEREVVEQQDKHRLRSCRVCSNLEPLKSSCGWAGRGCTLPAQPCPPQARGCSLHPSQGDLAVLGTVTFLLSHWGEQHWVLSRAKGKTAGI